MEPWPSDVQLFQPYEVRGEHMKVMLKTEHTFSCDFCDDKADESETQGVLTGKNNAARHAIKWRLIHVENKEKATQQ